MIITRMTTQRVLQLCKELNCKGKKIAIPLTFTLHGSKGYSAIVIRKAKHLRKNVNCILIDDKEFFKKLWMEYNHRSGKGEVSRLTATQPTPIRNKRPDWIFSFKDEEIDFAITKEKVTLHKKEQQA